MITSKPTRYNGIVYRSRLEAKWAAMFDLLDIKFEYEPAHYMTSIGGYLPDFLLDGKLIVEIKPIIPTSDEFTKLCDVGNQTDKTCIFLCGFPLSADAECVYLLNRQTTSFLGIFGVSVIQEHRINYFLSAVRNKFKTRRVMDILKEITAKFRNSYG